jgi:hypothetical protein
MKSTNGLVLLMSSYAPNEMDDLRRRLSLKVSLDLLPHLFEDRSGNDEIPFR